MKRAGWTAFVALAFLGLVLFLWTAISAPVVLWSDSEADLTWAKAGLGVLRPVPQPPTGALGHQPKPAYLLFLRGAMRALPALGETRSIVVVQSLLLWGAIVGSSLWLARRKSPGKALAFGAIAFSFLRLRDASSAVMPEALAVAFLLPLTAAFLALPRRLTAFALLGLATAVLFYVRPNCGAVMLLLGITGLFADRRGRPLLAFAAGFAALVVPFSLAARPAPPDDPFHGLGYQVLEASADYYWSPSLGAWPSADSPRETALAELRRARENWSRTLAAPGADMRRELLWRGLHGLFGTEFYDARWSEPYRCLSTASRLASPFLLLAAATALLLAPWRREERPARAMGWLLLALVVGQSLLLGSNPRFVLPFLPVLFLLAIAVAGGTLLAGAPRRLAVLAVFFLSLLLLARERHVLDWQWGQIESAGVKLDQRISRGSLPATGPATLHLRIAAPLQASSAGLEIFGPGARLLYTSREDLARQRPFVTVPLPDWLLEANRRGPVELALVSTGDYGRNDYLLFPVIPPPWGMGARREGSAALSPATGIFAGTLDWWAHAGAP
jgi:hypothetical protein